MIVMIRDYFVILTVFLTIDAVWLGVLAKDFYRKYLGHLTGHPNWIAAIITYLILVAGILIFVFPRAQGNPKQALFYGALFGLAAYGVYDFTNLATIKNWPLVVSLVDVIWGSMVCGLTALVAVTIINRLH